MQKKTGNFIITGIWVILFILFTVLIQTVDVSAIGPKDSSVGFASINGLVHEFLGVHRLWYTITYWLGFIPLSTAGVFAVIGLMQLVRRRSLLKVDKSIIALGIFYGVTIIVYVLFEFYIVNYRPILIDGYLEASYPSSHTMMACCFMAAAMLECGVLVKDKTVNLIVRIASVIIMAVIVIGRLVSGAHWFTDIIGGLLISGALIMGFYSVLSMLPESRPGKRRR
jgi:membrane-associated phospholipid phosphatase